MVAPLIVALAPLLTKLAANGLDLIGSAVMAKGKEVVEKELGVDIDQDLATDEGTIKLKQLQLDHEERLLQLALDEKKLDLAYYQVDAADRDSARDREVALFEADADWFNRSIASILALVVIIGGGYFLTSSGTQENIKFAIISLMSMVLGYYFGSSKGSVNKDAAISRLSKKD